MKVDFWGVRGTFPVCGKDKTKYGGHTICASIHNSEEEAVIIDAGTGIKPLGDKLIEERGEKDLHISIFLTHFHLDHIWGIPFFAPLYSSEAIITFYAPSPPQVTERLLNGITTGRYFPVDFKETSSKKIYKKAPEKNFKKWGLHFSSCFLRHPQGSIAYKIEDEEGSIIFATDTEQPEKGIDQRLVSFAHGVDAFIYDATFTPEEYESGKRGWGHSTWLEGTKIAREANVRNLYLSHFNPDHNDSQIDEILSLAKKNFSQSFGLRGRLQLDLKDIK